MRVALFATCLGDNFFADACADTVRLLRHFGAEVDFPEAQTCCGQPAYNSGHRSDARRMARHTDRVFADAEYVVLPSGSCAAMVRCFYPELLTGADRPADAGGVERVTHAHPLPDALLGLSDRTWDLCSFLVHVLGVEEVGPGLAGSTVAYHHGCHALRELRVDHEPVRLLQGAGAQIVPWEADRECCGFGGLFATKLPEVSAAMADRKLETLPAVDWVTSLDGGCLLQLRGRAARLGGAPPFEHLSSLLWKGVAK
jgi:L-lactate dehydrogenase complex protein LldE